MASQSTEHAYAFEEQTKRLLKITDEMRFYLPKDKNKIIKLQQFIWNDKLVLGVDVMDDEHKMGMGRANEFSQGLRKSARMFSKKNVLMVCSNQLRDSPTGKTTPGGNAIPFYSSVRMEVMPHFPISKIKREKTIRGVKQTKIIGIHSDVTITKNSLDDPFRKVPIYIIFGYGIDDVRGNLTWLKENKGLKKYTFGDQEFSGIEPAIAFIEENGLEKKLKKEVIDLWNELEDAFKTQRKPKQR